MTRVQKHIYIYTHITIYIYINSSPPQCLGFSSHDLHRVGPRTSDLWDLELSGFVPSTQQERRRAAVPTDAVEVTQRMEGRDQVILVWKIS